MLLIPYYRFELYTSLSPEEVTQILSATTARPLLFGGWKPDSIFFVGTVSNNRFQLYRKLRYGIYRNIDYAVDSFRPPLYGILIPDEEGTRIQITFRYHPVIMALFAIACFAGLITAGVVTIMMYLWMMRCFNREVVEVTELMRDLFRIR